MVGFQARTPAANFTCSRAIAHASQAPWVLNNEQGKGQGFHRRNNICPRNYQISETALKSIPSNLVSTIIKQALGILIPKVRFSRRGGGDIIK